MTPHAPANFSHCHCVKWRLRCPELISDIAHNTPLPICVILKMSDWNAQDVSESHQLCLCYWWKDKQMNRWIYIHTLCIHWEWHWAIGSAYWQTRTCPVTPPSRLPFGRRPGTGPVIQMQQTWSSVGLTVWAQSFQFNSVAATTTSIVLEVVETRQRGSPAPKVSWAFLL